jgi:(2Fe-2S) ferredoxin
LAPQTHLAVIVCQGPTCGGARGSAALYKRLMDACSAPELADRVHLSRETCFGECQKGPNILVHPVDEGDAHVGDALPPLARPGAVLYTVVTGEALEEIIESHLLNDRPVTSLVGRMTHKSG